MIHLRYAWSIERLQAFAARCLIARIEREEDVDMRALYRRYLENLQS